MKKHSKHNSPQRRLGEHLLSEGLLNVKQLDEAIEYQCIYGGKLGTSLIELGLIKEDQLAKILSRQLQLHYIKPELLMNVSPAVLRLIPKETALKYQVVPYHKDGKKLYIAINEAMDLTSINELSSQLGLIIIPLAIPEIRLLLALKKHYDISLSPRFETLAAQKVSPGQDKAQTLADVEEEVEAYSGDGEVWPLLGDDESYAAAEQEIDSYSYDNPTQKEKPNSTDLFQQLANAQDRDDIARAIITHLKIEFPNCALLMVRRGNANGWLSAVENPEQPFSQVIIPLQEPSVLSKTTKNHSHYLGPMNDSPQNRIILDFFAVRLPQDVLVMPITVQDRLVCILYIQGELNVLKQHLSKLQNIVDKAEMSFKLLILRNKILAT